MVDGTALCSTFTNQFSMQLGGHMNFALPMITSILVIIYIKVSDQQKYTDSQKLDQSNFHNIEIFIPPSKNYFILLGC